MTARKNIFWIGLVVLLFLGALFWAKDQDPFFRKWFTLKTANHNNIECVAVLPKPIRQYPVIIFAHGAGEDLLKDGTELRQMAEMGLAAVSLEYNKTNKLIFSSQFEALIQYVFRQKWVNTNAIAWVGYSLGANGTFDFALQHPEEQPQLLVQLDGAGAESSTFNFQLLTNLHCPVLFVHGEHDEVFPVENTKRLASVLQTNGLPVELKIIPGISHDLQSNRGVVFRCIGEFCLSRLVGKDAWQNYHSIGQWQIKAPPLWLFWLPAAVWIVCWIAWPWYRKAALPEKIKLQRYEIALRWLAVLLATWALAETAIHLITPYFSVNDRTLAVARKYLVQPKARADFEYLAAQPIWHGQKLKTLLEHVELAGYNRALINWQLDEKNYQDFVLSPTIEPSTLPPPLEASARPRRSEVKAGNPQLSTNLNWRRPLWEEFYPRIRHESSLDDAVEMVVRHLRERVTIATFPNPPQDVPTIWLRQITDEDGFEIIYVAALRSVGVPARLNPQHKAEFWDGNMWHIAPQPCIVSWCK